MPRIRRSSGGNSSVGRAQPCQGWGREFESRFPLQLSLRGFRRLRRGLNPAKTRARRGLRLSGRVVMQRPAKPSTPVRFRPQPPFRNLRIPELLFTFPGDVHILRADARVAESGRRSGLDWVPRGEIRGCIGVKFGEALTDCADGDPELSPGRPAYAFFALVLLTEL